MQQYHRIHDTSAKKSLFCFSKIFDIDYRMFVFKQPSTRFFIIEAATYYSFNVRFFFTSVQCGFIVKCFNLNFI